MAVDAKKWLQDAVADAGLPAETVEALLKSDKLVAKVGEGVMLRSDYSRSQDELKADRDRFTRESNEWFTANKTVVDNYAADLAAYQQRYGRLDGQQPPPPNNFDPSKYMSMDAANAAIKKATDDAFQRSVQTNITITKEVTRAAEDYRSRFNKPLDLDALEKFALDKGLPLRQAYSEFIADEASAKAKADEQARIDAAIKVGVAAELSKHNLPGENSVNEPHVLFDRLKTPPDAPPTTEREQMAAFSEAWNSQPTARQ